MQGLRGSSVGVRLLFALDEEGSVLDSSGKIKPWASLRSPRIEVADIFSEVATSISLIRGLQNGDNQILGILSESMAKKGRSRSRRLTRSMDPFVFVFS